jgi:hypothetical protein
MVFQMPLFHKCFERYNCKRAVGEKSHPVFPLLPNTTAPALLRPFLDLLLLRLNLLQLGLFLPALKLLLHPDPDLLPDGCQLPFNMLLQQNFGGGPGGNNLPLVHRQQLAELPDEVSQALA